MRETIFIKQNAQKWQDFEKLLDSPQPDADKLSELFVQVTDDLSYARTFYAKRSVRVYLNGLAQKIFFLIYKSRRSIWKRVSSFWTHELPSLTWNARKSLYLSFSIFIVATLIGLFSAHADPDFSEAILGAKYVAMTEENIANGDPMAVYKEHGEFNMFLGITLNNITVALFTFAMGLVFAIGTIGILIRNGIMFGAFLNLFIKADLLQESLLSVMMHGTLELSSIAIAGAAGITMGSGLVFPGSYSRMKSFQITARRGINLLLGTLPLFLIAGFIESYFTRHTEAPNILRVFFILSCLAFIIFYFWWYPRHLAKSGRLKKVIIKPVPESGFTVDLDSIKSTGDIYYETYVIIRSYFGKILTVSIAATAFYCVGIFTTTENSPTELFQFPNHLFGSLSTLPKFIHNSNHPLSFAFWILAIGSVITYISWLWFNDLEKKNNFVALFSISLLTAAALSGMTILDTVGSSLAFLLFIAPFIFFIFYSFQIWGFHPGNSIAFILQFIRQSFVQITTLSFILLLSSILFFLILDSGITRFLLDAITMNLNLEEETGAQLLTVLYTGINMLLLIMVVVIWYFAFVLQFYSCLEINSATGIMKQLEELADTHQIRGLERE